MHSLLLHIMLGLFWSISSCCDYRPLHSLEGHHAFSPWAHIPLSSRAGFTINKCLYRRIHIVRTIPLLIVSHSRMQEVLLLSLLDNEQHYLNSAEVMNLAQGHPKCCRFFLSPAVKQKKKKLDLQMITVDCVLCKCWRWLLMDQCQWLSLGGNLIAG